VWTRLDDSKLKNVGGANETAIAFRVYGLNGQHFPRLVISLYDSINDAKNTAIVISVSRKENSKSWWNTCGIPRELIDDASDLLKEFSAKNKN
jgi:hypothetical protein